MKPARRGSSAITRGPFLLALVCGLVMASSAAVTAQVSPEEHARHHPGQQGEGAGAAKPSGDAGGMMGGMGEMMKNMGVPPPKELYPSLMALPDLPLEMRAEVQAKAHERMKSGTARLSDGLGRLAAAAPGDDWQAMQAAMATIREGLAEFESGLAAHQALAEGKAPRSVAMHWFKSQMNLLPPASSPARTGPFGLGWFHFAAMLVLVAFTAAMVWMYFHKMRRAADLVEKLTAGAALPASPANAAATGNAAVAVAASSRPSETGTSPERWSGRLAVCRVFVETPTIKTFRLVSEGGEGVPFRFLPGQFLTLAMPIGGKVVKRSYTIASSPTVQGYVEITVKREENGTVSKHLHDHVAAGDMLDLSAPMGKFCFAGVEAPSIVLIGGGVGITPLMSVVRYLTDIGWPGRITLLFVCRDRREFVFRDELTALERRHPNLRVVPSLTREAGKGWKGLRGRLTRQMIADAVPDLSGQRIHVCGPQPMMQAAEEALVELGVPPENIRTEAFGAGKAKRKAGSPASGADAPDAAAPATVSFAQSGKVGPIGEDETILDVADTVGVDIENSCRAGTCGSCKVRLVEGSVEMETDDALEPDEKASGWVLACQAKTHGSVKVDA